MITNQEELRELASVIFAEVQQSYREQGIRPGLQFELPFDKQPHIIQQAYIRGAAAANTHLIKRIVMWLNRLLV